MDGMSVQPRNWSGTRSRIVWPASPRPTPVATRESEQRELLERERAEYEALRVDTLGEGREPVHTSRAAREPPVAGPGPKDQVDRRGLAHHAGGRVIGFEQARPPQAKASTACPRWSPTQAVEPGERRHRPTSSPGAGRALRSCWRTAALQRGQRERLRQAEIAPLITHQAGAIILQGRLRFNGALTQAGVTRRRYSRRSMATPDPAIYAMGGKRRNRSPRYASSRYALDKVTARNR